MAEEEKVCRISYTIDAFGEVTPRVSGDCDRGIKLIMNKIEDLEERQKSIGLAKLSKMDIQTQIIHLTELRNQLIRLTAWKTETELEM